MNITTPAGRNAEQLLLLAAHMARDLPGNHQVLDDELMQQVLAGERRLTRTQFNALVASPLTLCRLRFLESRRLAANAAESGTDSHARQHHGWQGSQGLLLAAAGSGTDCSLHSDDGLWALHALTTGRTTRLLLQLRRPEDEGDHPGLRFEPDMQVAVLDGAGGTLLCGALDADGELEAVWERPQDLRSHLALHGGGWTVQPA